MPDFAKGCFFVGAAVAVGILAGLLVPQLVDPGPERSTTIASRKPVPPRPVMPDLTGLEVKDAEQRLDDRGIDHDTAGGLFGVVVPSFFEVCETEPAPGEPLQGTALLHVDAPGLCT